MHRGTPRSLLALAAVAFLAIASGGCALTTQVPAAAGAAPAEASSAEPVVASPPPPRLLPPTHPSASDSAGGAILRAAGRIAGPRILVSIKDRWLWYVVGLDTVLSAPVAVGMGEDFVYQGKKYHFATPVGGRRVLKKEQSPIWTVPEWHYLEKAAERGLEVIRLTTNARVRLSDGSSLVVRGQDVGRLNQFGNLWAFTPGTELIFDNKIFVPPPTTRQRRVPDALGPYKLDTGDGYLIHGTHVYNAESIGQAVSHGCVRMDNTDLERLYGMVAVGTPVFIF